MSEAYTDDVHIGDKFVARDRNSGNFVWEVLTEPAYPTYGGDKLFVWAKALKNVNRNTLKNGRTTVFFLPIAIKEST